MSCNNKDNRPTTKCGIPLIKGVHPTFMHLIPLTFDNTLSYYEQLCAFAKKLDEVIDVVNCQSMTICEFESIINDIIAEFESKFVTVTEFNEFKSEIGTEITNLWLAIRNIQSGVGEWIETGTEFTYDGNTYTANTKCEIFNSYDENEYRNQAAGSYSHAEGRETKALGTYSHTEGDHTVTTGNSAHAEGQSCKATGEEGSHAEGRLCEATGDSSHAEGNSTVASGDKSHAEGYQSVASGLYSHSQNYHNTASGQASTAMGNETTASGTNSVAMGYTTHATGIDSVAMGENTSATGSNQIAIGSYNIPNNSTLSKIDTYGNSYSINKFPFIIGNGYYGTTTETAVTSDAFKIDAEGKVYVGADTNGVDIKQFYDSFAVGSGDNNYVLTASYSGGTGSYSWKPTQGGGGGGGGTVTTGAIKGINNDNDSWSFNHSPYYSRAKQQNNIVVLEIYGYYQSINAIVVPVAEPRRVLIANLTGVTLPNATILVPALCTSATFSNGTSEFIFEITTTGAIYLNYTSMVSFDITQGNKLIANISYVVDSV